MMSSGPMLSSSLSVSLERESELEGDRRARWSSLSELSGLFSSAAAPRSCRDGECAAGFLWGVGILGEK